MSRPTHATNPRDTLLGALTVSTGAVEAASRLALGTVFSVCMTTDIARAARRTS
jgi:hypothetical protein